MSSYCVRKPYTVVVAVIMVLVLGVISFFGMTTDLLPTLELPYIVVVTTYPGADPERVETGVTAVLESGLGTVNGVSNVQSVSSENMSMVILEFEESTNMDSAMVKLSSAVDQVKGALPETTRSLWCARLLGLQNDSESASDQYGRFQFSAYVSGSGDTMRLCCSVLYEAA